MMELTPEYLISDTSYAVVAPPHPCFVALVPESLLRRDTIPKNRRSDTSSWDTRG